MDCEHMLETLAGMRGNVRMICSIILTVSDILDLSKKWEKDCSMR